MGAYHSVGCIRQHSLIGPSPFLSCAVLQLSLLFPLKSEGALKRGVKGSRAWLGLCSWGEVELTGDTSHLLMPQRGDHVLQMQREVASSLIALSHCQDEAITSKWLSNRSCRRAPGVQAGGTAGDDRLSLQEQYVCWR